MALWNGYIVVYNIPGGWTVPQRVDILNNLKELGLQTGLYPNLINHTRRNLTDTGFIFEALFDDAEITRANIVSIIALIVELPEAAVDALIEYEIMGEGLDISQSRAAMHVFLSANIADWETV